MSLFQLNKYFPINNFASSAAFLFRASFTPIKGDKKKYPKVVQLPITYRCNSKCVMCNIWQMDHNNEMTLEEFGQFLKDPIFSKAEAVGINGGEPTLIRNLSEYAKIILELPKIKSLNIITHGFNKKQMGPMLQEIYASCKAKKVSFHVSISLDGYGDIHNIVRGLKVYNITSEAILEVNSNKKKYCDTFDVGCTIVKQNVDYLKELDAWARIHNIDIKYRMGIENKRIESDKLVAQYSLLYFNILQSAKEFFHSRYLLSRNLKEKFKYFSIYFFLTAEKKKRLLGCYWKDEGITMDSRGDLFYCAVASDKIGGLRVEKGEDIFFSENNIAYRKKIVAHDCNNCIHDYNGKTEFPNLLIFFKEIFFEQYYWLSYYLKSRFA
jgi:MoaA/NifB/PqqE/SkfB family radical SAM enzyme